MTEEDFKENLSPDTDYWPSLDEHNPGITVEM